ncbi:MAG: metallophosphoesterase [Phycisphaerales bacterium]|nr:metallophosphoesterase [Phycisphaerales bacterium]
MNPLESQHGPEDTRLSRRTFLQSATAASLTLALPGVAAAAVGSLAKPVRIGLIADLHHDVMHDGPERLNVFLERMATVKPDAIMQLGDFAYPSDANAELIARFNAGHDRALHVIGNHDTDAGCTKAQCIERWGIPDRYYTTDIEGLKLIVLDGNDTGSPTYSGGYPSYIGPEQVKWLKEQLATLDGPIIVASHQPLAGTSTVDNAEEIQAILGDASDKVILAINGHTHIDDVMRIKGVPYLHVNSASYQWVGGDHRHESYPAKIHEEHPWISCTCPYRDSLFAMLEVEPEHLTIRVTGGETAWVGESPAALGVKVDDSLIHGEEIAPRIRNRQFLRVRT